MRRRSGLFQWRQTAGRSASGNHCRKGRRVAALKRETFFRALRCDKLILSALQTTVDLYLSDRAAVAIPALAMLRVSNDELRVRASKIKLALEALPMKTTVGDGKAQVGGGTLPRSVIPSVTLDLRPLNLSLKELATRLRAGTPPVVGYITNGSFKLDLRTVFLRQDEELFRAVHRAFQNSASQST